MEGDCWSLVEIYTTQWHSSNHFYYDTWESVKDLQYYCGRLDFKPIHVNRKLTFLRALCDFYNLVVRTCFSVFKRSQEFNDLTSDFNCIIDVFFLS